jgi:hypothetical protein
MFIVIKSYKKILTFCHFNVIHMCIFATCIYSATICLLSVSGLFLCSELQTCLPMLFSLHSGLSHLYSTSLKYLTRNQFLLDFTHLYILHNVLLLKCSVSYLLFLLWIYGTLNKITIIITHTCQTFPLNNKFTKPAVHSTMYYC